MADTQLPVTGLNVPALPDNAIWFANSASWTSYWGSVTFTVNAPVADTNDYGLVKAANTNVYVPSTTPVPLVTNVMLDPLGDGNFVTVKIPDADYVAAILTYLQTLDAAVKQMRIAQVIAGQITNAQ